MISNLFLDKKIVLLLLILFFSQCSSISTNNAHLQTEIPSKKLQKDVAFTHKKLQKLHPKLDYYISKEQLDFKFDSLKSSLNNPLTPLEFYKKNQSAGGSRQTGTQLRFASRKRIQQEGNESLTKKRHWPVFPIRFYFLQRQIVCGKKQIL